MNTTPPEPLPAHSLVRRAEGVVLRRVAGEHMLVPTVAREVDLDSLFLLNETGVFIWEQLGHPRTAAELADAVAARFGVPAATARADAEIFLASLLAHRLAERTGPDER